MVLCGIRAVFKLEGGGSSFLIRADALRRLRPVRSCGRGRRRKGYEKKAASVPAVLASRRNLALFFIKERNRERAYSASFTIEAALVLPVIFLAVVSLLSHAFQVHDMVSGTMILEETMEKARHLGKDDPETEEYVREGISRGNPRLWLGAYTLKITEEESQVTGKAQAGDWEAEVELRRCQPEAFLRRTEAVLEMGDLTGAGEGGL